MQKVHETLISTDNWVKWHAPVIEGTAGRVKEEHCGPGQPGQKV
jgi:hypothetical protein